MKELLMVMQLMFGDGDTCEVKYSLFPDRPDWYVLDDRSIEVHVERVPAKDTT